MKSHDIREGQTVTAGRFGPPLMVIAIDGENVTCWDIKAGRECRYSASQLMKVRQ